jgi:hypothetical protein
MGHCGEFGDALSANTVQSCGHFRTVGYSTGFGYVLWAIAQDFVKC